MKRTLKRELKELEFVSGEANEIVKNDSTVIIRIKYPKYTLVDVRIIGLLM